MAELHLARAGAFLAACIACNAISGQNPRMQAQSPKKKLVIAFDEVERKLNFDLWLSRGGCPMHGYMLKKSTFL